jgi:crotonobetainyl-CoA:carnitine CoA-transferase CaiB-like acyl-CoA transferase
LARDERFATNTQRVKYREVLVAILEEAFRERTAAQWVARCRRASIPASLVRGVREALRTPEARALIASVEHPEIGDYDAIRNPVRINGERLDIGLPPPSLGQHTDAIVRELTASNRKKSGARSSPSSPPPARRSR